MLTSVGLVTIATLLAAGPTQRADTLNASWWKQAPKGEQTGFVLGFFDCSHPSSSVRFASSADYRKFLDNYLDRHPTASIPGALHKAPAAMHPAPPIPGGEEYRERHGWLDGEWWGDSNHGDADEKLGYAEGYLSCEYRTTQRTDVRQYVSQVNRYFSKENHQHQKIADVLQPILDRGKGSN